MFLNLSMRLMSFSSSIIFDSRCSLRAFCDMVSRMSGRAWYSRCSWSHVLLRPWTVKAKRETGWCRCLVCICFHNRFHCRLTSWSVCLLTFRTDFRFSIDTCVMAACSLCSFRKLLYSSRAFCSSSMRFCKYLGSFPKCCKKARGNVHFLPRQNRQNYFLECFFSCVQTP